MKSIILFLFGFISTLAWCQSNNKNSFQFFINPVIQKFGNLNEQYIKTAHENIEVNYLKKPSFELGITYARMFNNSRNSAWGVSAGISWKKDFYRMNYRSVHFLPGGSYETGNYRFISALFFDASVENIGITAGVHRNLTDNIRLNFLLHQYFRYSLSSNHELFYTKSTVEGNITPAYGITEKITKKSFLQSAIVPELNISACVFKNINLVLGIRFKFWSFEDYLTTDAYGSFTSSQYAYDSDKILHQSAINSRDMSYYFGIMYDIPVFKEHQ